MGNSRTIDLDIAFFENIFSMLAYGKPDNFYDQIAAIAREHLPRRIEIGFGPLSEGYEPIGSVEIGPFTAAEILTTNRTSGIFKKVNSKLLAEEGNAVWKYMQDKEPPTSIRVDIVEGGPFPLGIELKIKKYLDVSKNYREVNYFSKSLDDLQLNRDAVMIWYVRDPTKGEVLTPLLDKRLSDEL